jgi:hypothetical protein
MQTGTARQRAETCLRLALGAGDPQIAQQLIATAAEWLAEETREDGWLASPPLVPRCSRARRRQV